MFILHVFNPYFTNVTLRPTFSGMVQTEAQYKFVYMAVQHHIDTVQQRMQVQNNLPPKTFIKEPALKQDRRDCPEDHLDRRI